MLTFVSARKQSEHFWTYFSSLRNTLSVGRELALFYRLMPSGHCMFFIFISRASYHVSLFYLLFQHCRLRFIPVDVGGCSSFSCENIPYVFPSKTGIGSYAFMYRYRSSCARRAPEIQAKLCRHFPSSAGGSWVLVAPHTCRHSISSENLIFVRLYEIVEIVSHCDFAFLLEKLLIFKYLLAFLWNLHFLRLSYILYTYLNTKPQLCKWQIAQFVASFGHSYGVFSKKKIQQ